MTVIFISREGKQLGQFSEQEVSEGLKSGRFLAGDLAWKQGMADWRPLNTFVEFGGLGSSETDLSRTVPQGAIISNAPAGKVDIGLCLSRAWETYKAHFGICVLSALVFIAISIALQVPVSLTQMGLDAIKGQTDTLQLTLVGSVILIFFMVLTSAASMILTGGLLYFYINSLRTAPNFKDLFAGFRPPNWWRIVLAGVVWTLGFMIAALLMILPGVLLSVSMKSQTVLFALGGIFMLVVIYFSVAVSYAFPLIIDRKLGAMEGLFTSIKTVHTQWWQIFALFLVLFVLMVAGMLACCVGIVFALPLAYLVLAEGYRQLFGDPGTDR